MPRRNKQNNIQARLAERQAAHDELTKRRSDNGQGFKRPGSLSGKK